jgi:hypothetical protein
LHQVARRIFTLAYETTMKIPSIIKSIVLPNSERPPAAQTQLNVGDKLVGKVLELKGDSRAMVDFGRFRALSDLGFPVKEGEIIHVKIMDKGVPLRLRRYGAQTQLGSKPPKRLALGGFPPRDLLRELQTHMRQVLPDTGRIQMGRPALKAFHSALENLLSQFEPIRLKRPVSDIHGQLRQFIQNSGVFYEKKLEKIVDKFMHLKADSSTRDAGELVEIKNAAQKDSKANLLMVRNFLAGKEGLLKSLGAHDQEGLRNAVEKLLTETVTRQTDTALKPLRSETVQVFTYLIPVKELEQDAKVKVYYPRKGQQKSQNGFKISLLLTMEKVGSIRTDLFLEERNLAVDFFVTEPEVEAYVDTHLNDLRHALGESFDRLSLRVSLSEQKIEDFEFEDISLSSDSLIDVKV